MKNLKTYNQFKVNEELDTMTKRTISLIPKAILGALGKKLFGIYPMLNTRWQEMKKATKGLKDSPLSLGSAGEMKHDLEPITLDKLPPNSLKWSMFLRDWNVYLAKDYKSKGGGDILREVIYISKDKVKEGDQIRSYRLNDSDIYSVDNFTMSKNSKGKEYPSKLKDPASYPMVIMVVKYDEIERIKAIQEYLDDICYYLRDELPVIVEPYFSKDQNFASISIRVKEKKYPLVFTDELSEMINEFTERCKQYLRQEGYNFKTIIKCKVQAPLFYNGTAGRFGTEIIPTAKDYSWKMDEGDGPVWNRSYKTLDVSKASWVSNDKLYIGIEDVKTLLGDLDNCTKSWSLSEDIKRYPERAEEIKKENSVTEIKIEGISIVFNP